MDPGTHTLVSLALARGLFPRRCWKFVLGIVLAGTLADLDLLMLLFGPDAYLTGRFTITHSLIGAAAVVAIAAVFVKQLESGPNALQKAGRARASFGTILLATFLAATVHLLMDLATPSGIAVLSPFRQTRFAWDLLPSTDLYILALLLAGILVPELLRLVSSEIGVKEKAPRGRNGAIAALTLVLIYVGARAALHGNAIAQLDAHSYRGESPRQIAAFPDSLSLLTWHGVVETATQICTVEVPATQSVRFDSESAACMHKPEESPLLTAAQATDATRKFLQAARFPKASVGSRQGGSEVVIRDVRDAARGEARYALAARILLDPAGQVTSQKIVWASRVHLR